VSQRTLIDEAQDPTATTGRGNTIPLTARLAIEIPQPKDWQAFQRNCVLLFRDELQDPNAGEYGRNGQDQRGIDVLGRRGGRGDHFVGVQCRRIDKPLREPKILSDAREALTLQAGLRELIFATTAPDDTAATDAALSAERKLRAEGHDLTISVYGWGQLQTLIAVHEVAYNAFHPSAVASTAVKPVAEATINPEIAALIASQVGDHLRAAGIGLAPRESGTSSAEDPALHARIDTYRDLGKSDGQLLAAQKGLLALLEKEDLSAKPWARFRLETNLGTIALDLGREEEAAERFETAHLLRPDDSNGLANLSLARTIQRRFDDGMSAAQEALRLKPVASHAVAYLLQAAARSDWQGDPETLIPTDMIGTAYADFGIAEFIRRRDLPGWAPRTLELARRHPDVIEFKGPRAIAILAIAIDGGNSIAGGQDEFSAEELNLAANDMKAVAERCLDLGFGDRDDLVAYLNNASVLLRLCERHTESEKLLERGIPVVGREPQLLRLLALAKWVQEKLPEAIAVLDGDTDPENQLLRLQLRAANGEAELALSEAAEIDAGAFPEKLQVLRWRLIGEFAVQLDDAERLRTAAAGLRAIDPDDIIANLFEIRAERNSGVPKGKIAERLRDLAASASPELDMASRYFLAQVLKDQGQPDEASRLLESHVDLTRPSPSTTLYLQALADARRDAKFRSVIEGLPAPIRADPAILWLQAAHAWNQGDLQASLKAVQTLLQTKPEDPGPQLLQLEIFIRQDRSAELYAELEKPIERLLWRKPNDKFRVAALLGHFGFRERAAAFAYRLYLEHRDLSRAWMTLSMLVLEEGRGDSDGDRLWSMSAVGPNAAVDIVYDDGRAVFFVVEADPEIRRLDEESWEPGHPLVRSLLAKRAGDRFVGPDGREGAVRAVRHKYVARLHFVLENHESRFPEIFGFRGVSIDAEKPGGLDNFIAQLKERHDWLADEESQYTKGRMPLGVFAHRVGMDTIDVSAGLAGSRNLLNVAIGTLPEREAAARNVRGSRGGGCALDLLAFWTAWRLDLLGIIERLCGPIRLPQSVLDRLRARRERFESHGRDGLKTAGYENGRMSIHELSPAQVDELRADTDRAIAWAENNSVISPVVMTDDLAQQLRDFLRQGRSDLLDALILARQTGVLLISDDAPTRELEASAGGNGGAWLHSVLGIALERGEIAFDRYVQISANLVEAGHNYLGVSGNALVHAARLDAAAGECPGRLFNALSRVIGGNSAEPASHIAATVECLRALWSADDSVNHRQPVSGQLLRRLITDRPDYRIILRTVLARVRDYPNLFDYVLRWLQGHFLHAAVLGAKPSARS